MRPVLTWLAVAALVACGSRTDLEPTGPRTDSGSPLPTVDAARTVADANARRDAFQATDAAPPRDAHATCNDGGPPVRAYLFDDDGVLYSYDTSNGTYEVLGTPECGGQGGAWTMTASRENAYIQYNDGSLYAVDLRTLACSPTAFQTGQLGITYQFGMAVADVAGVETFFVYGEAGDSSVPILAKSDLSSFVLTEVGEIQPLPPQLTSAINLSADALGHLYAFAPSGVLLQIDQATGSVLQDSSTGVRTDGTWAGLTSGDKVFLFVDGRVASYDPATDAITFNRSIDIDPIGAGSFLVCPDE